jgi:hypothetical protein
MKQMIRIYSEWDIGQDKLVFSSEQTAKAWLYNIKDLLLEEGEPDSVIEQLIADNLVGFETLEFIE